MKVILPAFAAVLVATGIFAQSPIILVLGLMCLGVSTVWSLCRDWGGVKMILPACLVVGGLVVLVAGSQIVDDALLAGLVLYVVGVYFFIHGVALGIKRGTQ